MKSLVFLSSGGGGTLRFINQCLRLDLGANFAIKAVIADRDCGALDFAKANAIPVKQIVYSRKQSAVLRTELTELEPDLIITNIHKILDPQTTNDFAGRLVNLHYSLLPSFGGVIGMKTLDLAMAAGSQIVGTSAHLVEEEVDAGQIIAQAAFPLLRNEARSRIEDRIFRIGCMTLLNALMHLTGSKKIRTELQSRQSTDDSTDDSTVRTMVLESPILFSPELLFTPDALTEDFWNHVKLSSQT